MRRSMRAAVTWVGIGLLAASSTVRAESPPAPRVGSPPRITGQAVLAAIGVASVEYHRATPSKPYSDGPLGMDITLVNRSDVVAKQIRVEQDRPAKGGAIAAVQTVVDVPAKGRVTVTLIDPDGLGSACEAKHYTVLLGGAGDIDRSPRKVTAHPACVFGPAVDNPFDRAKPDAVVDVRSHFVYVDDLTIDGPLACGSSFRVKGRIVNHSTKTASNVTAHLYANATRTVSLGATSAIDIPVNQSRAFAIHVDPEWSAADAALPFRIQDGTTTLQLHNQGLAVTPIRRCEVTMALEP
jgi:hypothetical protein